MRKLGLLESLVACSLMLSSCIYDLTPDVGPLIARGNEPVSDVDGGRTWRRPGADAGTDAGLENDDPTQSMDGGSEPLGDGAIALTVSKLEVLHL